MKFFTVYGSLNYQSVNINQLKNLTKLGQNTSIIEYSTVLVW
jgi:hypothetical protein